MKIQTFNRYQFGKKNLFGNFGVVEFDKNGVAEVSEEAAKYITHNHPSIMKEGENPLTEKDENEELKFNEAESLSSMKIRFTEMSNSLARKETSIKSLKRDLGVSNEEVATWKALTDDLRKEIEILKKANMLNESSHVPVEEIVSNDSKADLDLSETLEGKTKNDLWELCKELKYNEAEYKDLTKTLLIDYMIAQRNKQ